MAGALHTSRSFTRMPSRKGLPADHPGPQLCRPGELQRHRQGTPKADCRVLHARACFLLMRHAWSQGRFVA